MQYWWTICNCNGLATAGRADVKLQQRIISIICLTLRCAVLTFLQYTVSIHWKATMLPWKYNSRRGVIGVTNFITFRVTLQGCGVINFQRRALWNLLFCNLFLAILTEICLSSTHRFYVHRYSLLGGILFTHSNKLSKNSHSLFLHKFIPQYFHSKPWSSLIFCQ